MADIAKRASTQRKACILVAAVVATEQAQAAEDNIGEEGWSGTVAFENNENSSNHIPTPGKEVAVRALSRSGNADGSAA